MTGVSRNAGWCLSEEGRYLPRFIGLVLVSLSFLSCNESNSIVNSPPSGQNSPHITVQRDAFTFIVDASQFSYTSSGNISFSGDSVSYTVSVAGYRGGSGIFEVMDASGNAILTDSLNSDRTVVNAQFVGRIPARYSISFDHFTGRVSIALAGGRTPSVFDLQDFPNTSGTTWTYAVYDSLTHQADTAVVTVFGQTILPNTRWATLWQIAYRTRIDSAYVIISGDTVAIYSNGDIRTFVFPLAVGQAWKGPFFLDSTRVTQSGSISVPAGSFQNGFRTVRTTRAPNQYGRDDVWLVPRVGIVDVHLTAVGFSFRNTTWELLTYHIAP